MTATREVTYVIISPVRNEALHIEHTLRSVANQALPPDLWLVVDDGSTDETPAIIRRWASRLPYLRSMRLEERGRVQGDDRLAWAVVPIAFNRGLATLDTAGYDFIVKLDGDLEFAPDYFARVFAAFAADSELGVCGGHCFERRGSRLVMERVPDDHVRGATKVYRQQCFKDIGGIREVFGWDTIDELRAQMCGWKTRSLRDAGVVHLRPTCGAFGRVRGRLRWGRGSYALGYHPLFALLRGLKLAITTPYLIGGAAYVTGYVDGWLHRTPLLEDEELRSYVRTQQMRRLRMARGSRASDDEPRGVRSGSG